VTLLLLEHLLASILTNLPAQVLLWTSILSTVGPSDAPGSPVVVESDGFPFLSKIGTCHNEEFPIVLSMV